MARPAADDADELREFCVAVGSRIRAIREQQQMTQRDLAAACGSQPQYIIEIERGSNFTITTLFRLATALNVEPAGLLGSVR